jgi:hypothetical protein
MHVLTELREEYVAACLRDDALKSARQTRKDNAKTTKGELESAALSNDTERVKELMDDLRAMESAYQEIAAEIEGTANYIKELEGVIASFYFNAKEGGPKVDWTASLEFAEDAIYSGWDRRSKPGYRVFIDAELCEAEMTLLRKIKGHTWRLNKCDDRYHLGVTYPAYRNTWWSDLDGRKIMDIIAPFLTGGPLLQQAREFMDAMSVLKE